MQQLTPQDDTLSDILYSLQSQRYEMGGVFTVGGGTGLYMIKSPFNTECEVSLITVSTNNATVSSFAFSPANPSLTAPPTSTTVVSLGAIAGGSEGGNPLEGTSGFVQSSAPYNRGDIWVPMGRGAILYFAVNTGANTIVYAQVGFRRSYAHTLPDGVRVPPATQGRAYNRRSIRVLDGLSKQYSGFDAQYPTLEGGKEQYTHNEIPWEQNPQAATTTTGIRRRNR